MRRSSLIKLCVLVLGLSVTNLNAGVRAGVGVDDGYYDNNTYYTMVITTMDITMNNQVWK